MGRKPKPRNDYILFNPIPCGVGYAAILWDHFNKSYRLTIKFTPRETSVGLISGYKTPEEAMSAFWEEVQPMSLPDWKLWPQSTYDHRESVQEARKHEEALERRRKRYQEKKGKK